MVTLFAASLHAHHAHAGEVVGWVLLGIFCLLIWIALAVWPARVAEDKGHSAAGYFVFGLLCFPLALITAYLVHDRHQPVS